MERRCDGLDVLVSTPMEDGWNWKPDSGGLRVHEQRALHWREQWRHPHRFTEQLTLISVRHHSPTRQIAAEGYRVRRTWFGTLQAAVYRTFARDSRLIVWATLSEVTEQARGRIRAILRRALLGLADAVIVNGESGARYVRCLGAGANKVFRAPQNTDLTEYLALPTHRPEPNRHRLLYSGRMVELKGLVGFLTHVAAWATAHPSQKVEFWMLGDGPLATGSGHSPYRKILR